MIVQRVSGMVAMLVLAQLSLGQAPLCVSNEPTNVRAPSFVSVANPPGETHSSHDGDCGVTDFPAPSDQQAPRGGGVPSHFCITMLSCAQAAVVSPAQPADIVAPLRRAEFPGVPALTSVSRSPESPPPRS